MSISENELRPLRLLFNGPKNAAKLAEQLNRDEDDLRQSLELLRDAGLVRQVEPRAAFLWFITEAGIAKVKEASKDANRRGKGK